MFSIGQKTIYDKLFWLFIFLFSLLKIFVCRAFPLTFNDLCFCARVNFLSPFYIDHPPMMAYFLKFFSVLFGNTNLMPRICCSVVFFFTAYVLYCFVKESTKSLVTAQVSVLLFYSTPMLNMLECSSDIPFQLFFILSVYLFYYFIKTEESKYLCFLSLSIILGLLSKYTMLCFFPSFFLLLFISKEKRYLLKNVKVYISLFVPLIIFLVFILICKFPIDTAYSDVKSDVFDVYRLNLNNDISSIKCAFQFIGSQLIYYNSVLSFIYKDVLEKFVYEYVPFVKYYALVALILLSVIFSYMYYMYRKTKQIFFLFAFCFSIVIFICSVAWAFIIFPVEYCAKMSFMFIYVFIAYFFSKNIVLKSVLISFIVFGLYISLINPIYSLYGYDSLSPVSIINKIKKEYDFKEDEKFKILKSFTNKNTEKSIIVIPINTENMKFYSYYLTKSQYDFYSLFIYSNFFYSVKQNISKLNGKDLFVILEKEDWFSVNSRFIDYLLHKWEIFDSVEILNNDVILCRNFNYEQYRKYFFYCSYELKY